MVSQRSECFRGKRPDGLEITGYILNNVGLRSLGVWARLCISFWYIADELPTYPPSPCNWPRPCWTEQAGANSGWRACWTEQNIFFFQKKQERILQRAIMGAMLDIYS